MSYSREFLQTIPYQNKQKQIDAIVSSFIQPLLNSAGNGKKTFSWSRTFVPFSGVLVDCYGLTDAEIIAGFFTRFPGCNVYYEGGLESEKNTKIVIDWS